MNQDLKELIICRTILDGGFSQITRLIKTDVVFTRIEAKEIYNAAVKTVESGKKPSKLSTYLQVSKAAQEFTKSVSQSLVLEASKEQDTDEVCLALIQNYFKLQYSKTLKQSILDLENGQDVFLCMEDVSSQQESFMRQIGGVKPYNFMSNCCSVLEEIAERVKNPEKTGVIKWGISDFDRAFGGFEKKTLNIIAARPGMGKTALAIQIVKNLDNEKTPSLFFSLEMGEDELIKRIMSLHTGVNGSLIKKGFNGNETEFENFAERFSSFTSDRIFIKDNEFSINEIKATSIDHCQNKGVKAIFIDYLQLIKGGKGLNKNNQVEYLTRELKLLSKACDAPIFLLAQLSRAVESRGGNKVPIASDLRDSGAIEQDADSIIFPYRAEHYGITENEVGESTRDIMTLIVEKNRGGSPIKDGVDLNCKIGMNMIWSRSAANPSIEHNEFAIGNFEQDKF